VPGGKAIPAFPPHAATGIVPRRSVFSRSFRRLFAVIFGAFADESKNGNDLNAKIKNRRQRKRFCAGFPAFARFVKGGSEQKRKIALRDRKNPSPRPHSLNA
jgi:hypothetical protein